MHIQYLLYRLEYTVLVVPVRIYSTCCTGSNIQYLLYRLEYTVLVVPARICSTCCTGSNIQYLLYRLESCNDWSNVQKFPFSTVSWVPLYRIMCHEMQVSFLPDKKICLSQNNVKTVEPIWTKLEGYNKKSKKVNRNDFFLQNIIK